jgi:hypothetical protein
MSDLYPIEPLSDPRPADLAWLAGTWTGARGGEPIEEHWSEPAAGSIMGMFRWQRDGAILFYEFMAIEQAGETVSLRIKHFYPGLKGWEEKNESAEFVLVQLSANEAVFRQLNRDNPPWLIYRREAEDRLVTYFVRDNQPPPEGEWFVYDRQRRDYAGEAG